MKKSIIIRRIFFLIIILLMASEIYGQSAEAFIKSGNLKFSNQDYTGAIADYTKSISLDSSNAVSYCSRANAKVYLQDYESAISDYTIAIDIYYMYSEAYAGRGYAKINLQDLTGGIEDFNTAIELKPDNKDAIFFRGLSKRLLGDFSGAVEDFTRLIGIDPENEIAYIYRGKANDDMLNFDDAISDFSKAIELNPENGESFFNRGNVKRYKKDYIGAIEDYTKSLGARPDDIWTYIYRGDSRFMTRDLPGAIEDFTKVIDLDPEIGVVYFKRAKAKSELKDYAGAIEDYSIAIEDTVSKEIFPEYAEAYYGRGLAYILSGRKESGCPDFNKATELGLKEAYERLYEFCTVSPQQLDYMLIDAVQNNNLPRLKELVQKGANVSNVYNYRVQYNNWAYNDYYCYPIHLACDSGYYEIAQYLIEKGADVNSVNSGGMTPISGNRYPDIIRLLIDNGAEAGNLLLGDIPLTPDVVRMLITKGADVNAKNDDGITPLHLADTIDIARLFIENGADINAKDKDGQTPLLYALINEDQDIALFLIENGAEINTIGLYGYSPLLLAVQNDFQDITRLLIEKGADINIKDDDGLTPLMNAIINNHNDIARLLIGKGADVNVKNREGDTPLHLAKTAVIAGLLIGKGAVVMQRNALGQTPLHVAENADIARLLAGQGADVNSKIEFTGVTPLHQAKTTGIARLLIEKGADVNAKDNDGDTPLHFSHSGAEADFYSLLIEKGADVNAKNRKGKIPLHSVDSVKIARLFIEKGADVNAKDNDDDTPLFDAVKKDNIALSIFLIENGADVNAIDVFGVTPLYYVQSEEAAMILLEEGANVNLKDNAGNTPLHLAVNMRKDIGIVNLLIKKGADVNAKNKKGKTPLFEAFENHEIADLLINNGADINARDKDGATPLDWLVSISDIDDILYAINNGADVNAKDNYGLTPLFQAGTIEKARLLIERGADVKAKDIDGRTPLFYLDIPEIIRLLIEKGADVNDVASNGHTPFTSMLLEEPSLEAASVFLEKGYPIDFRNINGQTTLIIVSRESTEIKALEYLLNNNADAGIKDIYGKTALDYALALGKKEFVNLLTTPVFIRTLQSKGQQAVIELLEKDTTGICLRDNNGSTLLHYMVSDNCDTLFDFVVKRFINKPLLNVLNNTRQTPLLYAIDHYNSPYAIRLIEAGADINAEDCFGETSLFLADYRNLKDVSAALKKKKAFSKSATYPTELSIPAGQIADVISCWSLSPDSRTLITGDNSTIIKLWDIATGKEMRVFSGHTGEVLCLDFSPDGKLLISGSDDKTVKLWDIATGKELKTYSGYPYKVLFVKFLPDGKSFVSGTDYLRVRDIYTGNELLSAYETEMTGWEGMIFSSDMKNYLPVHTTDEITIGEMSTGKIIRTIEVDNNNYVYSICLSPDNKYLLSGGSDSLIRLWDITTGKKLKTFTGHGEYINSLCFSPDGKSFMSGDSKGNLILWDVASGKEIRSFPDVQDLVNSISFLPDGKSFITGYFDNNKILLWDTSNGKILRTFEGIGKNILSFDLSKNGSKILLGSETDVKLAEITSGIKINSFAGHRSWAFSVRFSPDYKTFLSGSQDSTIKLWDIATKKELQTFTGHGYRVNSVRFLPDGKSFISGSWDGTGKLWDIASGKELKSYTGHEYRINNVALSPDSKSFLTGSLDKSIKLWDVASGKELKTFTGHNDDVWGLDFSEDGKSFISGSNDQLIKFWDIDSGKELRSLIGHSGPVITLCFSADGKTILSGSGDKTIKLWDVASGVPVRTFAGHSGNVVGARFHPSGKYIISISDDKTVKYWNIESSKETASVIFIDSIDWVLFTPDKYYAATKNGAKALGWVKGMKVWNFDQWDLQYNRPDIVFSRMPDPDSAMIKMYLNAYHKRLKKMKFSESMFKIGFHTPEIIIEKETLSDPQTLELNISAVDTLYPMDRINVWINEVPAFGLNGISLRNEKQSAGVPVKKHLSLTLSEGDNKIEVSVLNSAGAESLKQTVYARNESSSVRKDLYFVAISCADYKEKSYNLKYSVKDGRDMARQFAGATDDYANVFIDTLFNADATRENVAALKQKLLKSNVDDQVILFTSGHGLLSDSLDFYFATYDIDFSHPEARGISFDDLENILDSIPARKKLLMMDACHSGEVDKEEIGDMVAANTINTPDIAFRGSVKEYNSRGADVKDTRPGITLNNSLELMQEMFTGLDKGTGTTVISAAAGKGYALESPQWNNGVFTYTIINGMKNRAADKNNDGIITISELKDYSIKQVELLTGGKQKPTARRESINYDWKIW